MRSMAGITVAQGLVGTVLLGSFQACAIYIPAAPHKSKPLLLTGGAGTRPAAGGRVASDNTSLVTDLVAVCDGAREAIPGGWLGRCVFFFFPRSFLAAGRFSGAWLFYWAASRHRLFLYWPVSRCVFIAAWVIWAVHWWIKIFVNEALSRAGMVRALAWANHRRKVVVSWLQRPPTSMASTLSLHRRVWRSSGCVRPFAPGLQLRHSGLLCCGVHWPE